MGSRTEDRIDDFTFEYIMKNTGFEIIEKGIWDKIEFLKEPAPEKGYIGRTSQSETSGSENPAEALYNRNELMDLFEIKLSSRDFKELSLLKGLNLLESEELSGDKSVRGRIKKYIYAVTSLYLENLRKSYNSSMQAINNNIQLQINREINELNAKNRERLIFIYYNIFRTLTHEISNLQVDLRAIRKIVGQTGYEENEKTLLDQKLEVLLGDIENIDRIMGLTLSNKYYVARKL
jgi:hypothetical protein